MGRRDYENEAATAAVDGYLSEPVVRALIVGAPGSQEGTLGGALKSLFGRSRRKSGLRHQNVLVLTPTSIRVFTCTGGRAWPPEVDEEVGAWPVTDVRVSAEAAEKWSAFSATESGSQTNRFYNIALTVPDADEPIVVQCPRTDSARATIQALEDATGSKPSKVTARRRKKQQRDACTGTGSGRVNGD
ncbi:MAG TPA: hypothetical protein VGK05_09640 [Acidimicrobiia bacterium]|jgi:hypothetical protein